MVYFCPGLRREANDISISMLLLYDWLPLVNIGHAGIFLNICDCGGHDKSSSMPV